MNKPLTTIYNVVLVVIICIVLLSFCVATLSKILDKIQSAQDKACQAIGHTSYILYERSSFCTDKNGYFYPVLMKDNSNGFNQNYRAIEVHIAK